MYFVDLGMKAKVIIEDGKASIELTPDSEFETDVIEKLHKDRSKLEGFAKAHLSYGTYSKHSIIINITDNIER